ncbi:hypothetical protein BO78DRAFT_18426 [Aspergillus sclerotiicarbonarius CBS 121057]|uniref:Uncharacterized protein n=1 Tax=Aspergillus sclerotiicarbonarius (strain CBS 121057 / IBT 28362) TaxID=1448318 RepID=A0A319DYY7_ASPSB|nr:hypothetical protein BO78DRAFT_18426 [Aspergillus sclerotiicarbonarius CBS 121057]
MGEKVLHCLGYIKTWEEYFVWLFLRNSNSDSHSLSSIFSISLPLYYLFLWDLSLIVLLISFVQTRGVYLILTLSLVSSTSRLLENFFLIVKVRQTDRYFNRLVLDL